MWHWSHHRRTLEVACHLVGTLPWGYIRDLDTGLAVPDPEKAPLIREMF
jgi:hypothetical protein